MGAAKMEWSRSLGFDLLSGHSESNEPSELLDWLEVWERQRAGVAPWRASPLHELAIALTRPLASLS